MVNLIFNWLSDHTPKPKPVTPAASKMLDSITTHLRNQPAAPAPIETKSEPTPTVTNVESADASASLPAQKTEEPPKKKKISVVKRNIDETVSLPSSSHVAPHANLIPSEPTARSRNEDRSDRRGQQQHGTQYDRYDHRAGREGQGYPGPYGDSRGPMAGAMHPAMGMGMPHMPMGMGMSPQQHAQMVYEQTRMRHGGMPQDGMFPGAMQGGFPHGRGQGAPVQGQRDDGNGRGKRRRDEVQGTGSSHGKGTVLFVRQIPADAETSALESHFAKFGKVQLLDRFNPTMAQVFFESHEEAAAALEAPEAVLGNRFIQLSWDKKARGLPEDKKLKKKAVTEDGAAEQTEEEAQQTEQSQQGEEGQADQDSEAREKKRAKFGKQSFLHAGAAPFHPGHGYYGAMPWGYDPRQGFPPGKQYPGKPFQKNSESTTPAAPAAHVITLAESKENLIKTKKSQYSMLLTKCTEWAKVRHPSFSSPQLHQHISIHASSLYRITSTSFLTHSFLSSRINSR